MRHAFFMSHRLKFTLRAYCSYTKREFHHPPEEQIVCRQISESNEESAPVDNVDPLLDLFSTDKFDSSIESIKEIELLSEIDDAKDASSA